jgi:hypothetical protein
MYNVLTLDTLPVIIVSDMKVTPLLSVRNITCTNKKSLEKAMELYVLSVHHLFLVLTSMSTFVIIRESAITTPPRF